MVMAIAREENGEFCVTVGPVTRTVGVPYYPGWLKVLAVN